LFRAISEIHEGRQYVCEEIKSLFFEQTVEEKKDQSWLRKLTKREVQIVKSLKEGFSSIEIASQLDLSTRTVEVHRHNILKKLGLKNTAALIDLIYKSEIYIDM
jgi:two-component system invasion response regulator UvrY